MLRPRRAPTKKTSTSAPKKQSVAVAPAPPAEVTLPLPALADSVRGSLPYLLARFGNDPSPTNTKPVVSAEVTATQISSLCHFLSYESSSIPTAALVALLEQKQHSSDGSLCFQLYSHKTEAKLKVTSAELEADSSQVSFAITDDHLRYDLSQAVKAPKSSFATMMQPNQLRFHGAISSRRCLALLLEYRKWLTQEFSEVDQQRFICVGSTPLYLGAIRRSSDLDVFVVNQEEDLEFASRFGKALEALPEHARKQIDFIVPGFGQWNLSASSEQHVECLRTIYLKEWPALLGASSFDEVVQSPLFHQYIYGIKSITLRGDLARRQRRLRPAAHADLIYLALKRRDISTDFSAVPGLQKLWFIDGEWTPITPDLRKRYIDTVRSYLSKRYSFSVDTDTIGALIEAGPKLLPFNYPDEKEEQEILEAKGGVEVLVTSAESKPARPNGFAIRGMNDPYARTRVFSS